MNQVEIVEIIIIIIKIQRKYMILQIDKVENTGGFIQKAALRRVQGSSGRETVYN